MRIAFSSIALPLAFGCACVGCIKIFVLTIVFLPEDKRNKVIRLTRAEKEYADTIISELRRAELAAVEEIGVERMQQLNENMALFVEFFSKAGGKNDCETDQ